MMFPTLTFLLFFIVVFGFAIPLKDEPRKYRWLLLISSLVFYLNTSLRLTCLLIFNMVVNYCFHVLIKVTKSFKKFYFVLALLFNVGFWGYFKYSNLVSNILLEVLSKNNIELNVPIVGAMLTVGISCYTFKNISHLVDFYKGTFGLPTIIDSATYITFSHSY